MLYFDITMQQFINGNLSALQKHKNCKQKHNPSCSLPWARAWSRCRTSAWNVTPPLVNSQRSPPACTSYSHNKTITLWHLHQGLHETSSVFCVHENLTIAGTPGRLGSETHHSSTSQKCATQLPIFWRRC